MDSHNVQRYITPEGYVRNEGNVQVGGFAPYPISYRSIVPRKGEAANLFVPVCLSASHIAYGSIRMEPVFMILGQSSAMAAVMAIDANTRRPIGGLRGALRKRLLDAGQILESPPAAAAAKLAGIVIDDAQAVKSGAVDRQPRFRRLPRRRLPPRWKHSRRQARRLPSRCPSPPPAPTACACSTPPTPIAPPTRR